MISETNDANIQATVTATADLGLLEGAYDAAAASFSTIKDSIDPDVNQPIAANEAELVVLAEKIEDMDAEVPRLVTDNYNRNTAVMSWPAAGFEIDSFDICKDQYFEFWAFVEAESVGMGSLSLVELSDSVNGVVASSKGEAVGTPLGDTKFSLLYKGRNAGPGSLTFTLSGMPTNVVPPEADNMPTSCMGCVQWGVRVWDEDMVDLPANATSC